MCVCMCVRDGYRGKRPPQRKILCVSLTCFLFCECSSHLLITDGLHCKAWLQDWHCLFTFLAFKGFFFFWIWIWTAKELKALIFLSFHLIAQKAGYQYLSNLLMQLKRLHWSQTEGQELPPEIFHIFHIVHTLTARAFNLIGSSLEWDGDQGEQHCGGMSRW